MSVVNTVASWKDLNGYVKNIYNSDETGCFWRCLPDQGFGEKGKGGQHCNTVS